MGGAKKAGGVIAKVSDKANIPKQIAKKNPTVAKWEKELSKYNGGMGFKDPLTSMGEMMENPSKFKDQWSEIFGFGAPSKKGGSPGSPVLGGTAITAPKYTQLTKNGVLDKNYQLGNADGWLSSQLGATRINQTNDMNSAMQNALSAQGQAESALASRGGLSSGARERMMKSNSRDANLLKQGVLSQGNLSRLGLESEAFDKNQAAKEYNIQTMMKDRQMAADAENAKYQSDMTAWAANQQAKATAAAGKK